MLFVLCRSLRSSWGSLALMLTVGWLLAGCAGESSPVTAEKSKYRAAGDAAPATDATVSDPVAPADPVEPATASPAAVADASGDTPPATVPATEPGPRPGAKGATNDATPGATLEVPNTDDLQELWAFMQELGSRQPRGLSQAEKIEDFQQIQNARLLAGNKILNGKPDMQMKDDVLQAMQEILTVYVRLQLPGATQRLRSFAVEMSKREDKHLAQYGKLLLFQLRIGDLVSQPMANGKLIVEEVQNLLEENKEADPTAQQNALILASNAAEMLEQAGMQDEAVQTLRIIAAELKQNKDPKIAEQAVMIESRATLVEANLTQLATAVLSGETETTDKLTAAVAKLLAEPNPSIVFVSPIQEVAQLLEYSGNIDAAKETYTALQTGFKDHENKKVAEIVAQMTTNALGRLDIIGQPFVVEGVTYDGKPFDWESYRGKVVLVDFWATWCQPCLQEIPNIRANYEAFKDQGFEVVGVNLNVDVAEYEQFSAVQELPWPSVFSQEQLDKKIGEDNWSDVPMAKRYGVDAIPFMVLVDKEGKVDSLHVRGPKLEARLTELLGKAGAEKPEGAKPEAETEKAEGGEAKEDAPPEEGKSSAVAPRGPVVTYFVAAPNSETQPAAAQPEANPYSAKPNLSADELGQWLEKMLDKPKTIQNRPGFTEAVAEGCDRLLAMDPKPADAALLLAVETKLHILHQAACLGSDEADEQLQATVKQFAGDARPKVARLIAFYNEERKALEGDEVAVEKVPVVLGELKDYFAQEKLAARHLRMASATVAIINRLEDGDTREKHFEEFGKTFATSSDKELARYGRKLAKKPGIKQSDLIGQELQLEGVTTQGLPLAWATYRGKVVVVDFWATWCGPCQKELPNVKAAYEQFQDQGFEVLGISIDKDLEALTQYLEQNPLPWPTVAGEGTEELATKYGVRGIPTLMLVDKQGKVAAVAHTIEQLQPKIAELLGK